MPYPFFLSYASNDLYPGEVKDIHLDRFFSYLNQRVRQLSGRAVDGFMAPLSIESGNEWKEDLIDALQSSYALVSLYSKSYFESEYCGKEMQVFLERRKQHRKQYGGKPPANVIPIYWHPCQTKIPRTFPEFEYRFLGNLKTNDKGVWDLLEANRTGEWHAIANDAALRVRDALEIFEDFDFEPLSEWPSIGAIHNAFAYPRVPLPEFDLAETAYGSDSVTFVYAGSKSIESWPYFPPKADVALRVVSAIAEAKEFRPHQLSFHGNHTNLAERLTNACCRNGVVVLLVDAESLSSGELRDRMSEYDRLGREHRFAALCTMILWNKNKKEEIERMVRETFPFFSSRQPPHYFPAIENAEQLFQTIDGSLPDLQREVVANPNRRDPTDDPGPPVVQGPGRK
jgi:hypothetical protein